MVWLSKMPGQELIPLDDAAAEFGVHRTTLFRAISRGELQSHTRRGDRRTLVDRSQVQRLVEDPAVQRCLQLIYDQFHSKSEWPVARDIQRALDIDRDDFDFLAVVEGLPQELGWRVRDAEGHAQLTLRGMARCEGSAEDVSAFLELVRACYERYVGGDDVLRVTSDELARTFGFDHATLGRLYLMVQIEAGFWSGLGKNADGWTLDIESERIRHFRDVRSLGDYVAAKQRAFQPRPATVPRFGSVPPIDYALGMPFHPVVQEAVDGLADTAAVVAAASAVEQLMSARLGQGQKYGSSLIARYFDLALRASPPDVRRVEALRGLVVSAFGAYRNLAAHGRMEFVGAQAREIVGLFSLIAREIDATPLPYVHEIIPWVPLHEANAETVAAFIEGGRQAYGWKSKDRARIPESWFCNVHQNFIDKEDVGISYGEGVETMPVCPTKNCAGHGWQVVHPMEEVASPVVGGRGQSAMRVGMPRRPKGSG